MKKDVKIALIIKDINELQILTKGLHEMNDIPAQYLDLAIVKSRSLLENLQQLENILHNDSSADIDLDEKRLAAEREAAERERLEAERLERERLEAERRAEEARLAEEKRRA